MGNQHGHLALKSGQSTPKTEPSSRAGSRKGSAAPKEGTESHSEDKTIKESENNLLPVEKLAKILAKKALLEENIINGITQNVFYRYLFPRYPLLAEKLYNYFWEATTRKHNYIASHEFRAQCEKYFGLLDDQHIRETFVKMWCKLDEEEKNYVITPEAFQSLLMTAYHVSMDHYSDGPQMCFSINKTLKAVVDGCFYQKTSLSSQFVSHWIEHHIPRLLLPLHRYAVHTLATSWRTLDSNEPPESTGGHRELLTPAGLELTTPVLEKSGPFGQGGKQPRPHLLSMSMSWLLAGALPPLYSRPQKAASPNNSGTGLSSFSFLSKIACAIPSHWTMLYDSDEHGLGANRFLHHVMNYRGPTLVIFRVQNNQKFCIATPCEWKESHHYWGGEEAAIFQLLPQFQLLERGSKILYLNLSVRGYPQGLRAGSDPRAPKIIVDGGFEKIEWQKIPYHIETIEVWGCGDVVQLEKQLEVKKWEVKEAEKQRTVKLSAADWLDHPDRYLLELAGRPQYHQNQT